MYSYYSCLEAILFGIILAAPIGPIALLCLRTTLEAGPRMGISIGLGAASADALYASLSLFGLEVFSAFLLEYSTTFKMFGGSVLALLALNSLFAKRSNKTIKKTSFHSGKAIERSFLLSTIMALVLTLANP